MPKKIIGTFVPFSALRSQADKTLGSTHATFATGRIFLTWLKKTKQHAWQTLPIHQTHIAKNGTHVASPYRGYGVGLDPEFLSPEMALRTPTKKELQDFINIHAAWLADYTLFCALRDFFRTDNWTTWPGPIRARMHSALEAWGGKLAGERHAHLVTQWRLHQDFNLLRSQAKKSAIELIGDLSFYLPLESPLVWKFQTCFEISKTFSLPRLSGILNGPKAHFGRQVWGHPLYAWHRQSAQNALKKFWSVRLAYAGRLYDLVRLDHAKGLYAYGSMDKKNPLKDKTLVGPGKKMFRYIIGLAKQNKLQLFCEDSGDNLEKLRRDMKQFRVSGIRIFRFAYNEKLHTLSSRYAHIDTYPVRTVVYSSTHDTETLLGYCKLLSDAECKSLGNETGARYSGDKKSFARNLRTRLLNSKAQRVILPLQDWLLTTERINIPGTEKLGAESNWRYRIPTVIEKLPKNIF